MLFGKKKSSKEFNAYLFDFTVKPASIKKCKLIKGEEKYKLMITQSKKIEVPPPELFILEGGVPVYIYVKAMDTRGNVEYYPLKKMHLDRHSVEIVADRKKVEVFLKKVAQTTKPLEHSGYEFFILLAVVALFGLVVILMMKLGDITNGLNAIAKSIKGLAMAIKTGTTSPPP